MLNNTAIFGLGGCGINITKKFRDELAHHQHGERLIKALSTYYVDSSSANLEDIDSKQSILITGMRGAGKSRKLTLEMSKGVIDKFDDSFKDFNILVFSLSGGTGSILSNLLVKKIWEAGKIPICFGVGSIASYAENINSLASIKSMISLSQIHKKPLPISLMFNDEATAREDVDNKMVQDLSNLLYLFDSPTETDITDVINFFDYTRVVSDYAPAVCDFLILEKDTKDYQKIVAGIDEARPVSVASILRTSTDSLDITPPYLTEGYYNSHIIQDLNPQSRYYILSAQLIAKRLERLENYIAEYKAATANYVETVELDKSNMTDDGIFV